MDLQKLFDLDYLFDRFPDPGFSWPVRILLLAIFLGSIILAIYAGKKVSTKDIRKKLWQKIQVWAWTNGFWLNRKSTADLPWEGGV